MNKNLERLEKKIRHYIGEAIDHFHLIKPGDRVLVALSGGKDSWGMLWCLEQIRKAAEIPFSLHALTLDQGQPGWDDKALKQRLEDEKIPHTVLHKDTYSIVLQKIEPGKTYCSLCSRLRRGILYRYARHHGFNKIALGHHRDDLNTSLLMSILYNGTIKSMPPKLLNDDKDLIVIRPLVYVQEKDLAELAELLSFPIIPCNLCGSQENLARQRVKSLIEKLAVSNPKVPSNILHALSSIAPSQLMDKSLWDFRHLESEQVVVDTALLGDFI
jgi:tRNA 2-thiocytidine biosynthesis protein TtcA